LFIYAYFIPNLAGENLFARCMWIIKMAMQFFFINVQDVQAVFAFYLINVTPSVFPVLPQPTHFPSPPMPLKVLSNGTGRGPKLVSIDPLMINCLVGNCPFAILMKQCHERNIKCFQASTTFSGAMTNWCRKSSKIPSP
jgi:hypothetical protein